jgi:methylmalonyl-CoA mutase N-terminal domain/subunit
VGHGGLREAQKYGSTGEKVGSSQFRRREKITQRRPDRVGVNAERRGSQRRMERERQTERAQKAQRLQTREKRK